MTRVDLNVSLDGYMTTTDQTPEDPFGADWERLTAAYTATRTFQLRLGHEGGTTGLDDAHIKAESHGIGAEILGAGMFGFHAHPEDSDWQGWWGPNPPFGVPVFVLTHRERESLAMEGGTTYHFLSASPQETLARAQEAAGELDVRIGGGARVVKNFLRAGLVDRLHVAIVPILLGRGESIWQDLRGFEEGREMRSEVAESGVVHVVFEPRSS
nr:dihydrofolate reductase family protein [Brachybacterium sp. YJGR34]